jgi:hypothetical protein
MDFKRIKEELFGFVDGQIDLNILAANGIAFIVGFVPILFLKVYGVIKPPHFKKDVTEAAN